MPIRIAGFIELLDLNSNLWLFWPRFDLAKSHSSRGWSPRYWFVVLPDVPDHPCVHVLVPVDHIGHISLVKADLLCILCVQEKFFHMLLRVGRRLPHTATLGSNSQASTQPDFPQQNICLAACDGDDFSFLVGRQGVGPQLPTFTLIENLFAPRLAYEQRVLDHGSYRPSGQAGYFTWEKQLPSVLRISA